MSEPANDRQRWMNWRAARLQTLLAPDSWIGLVGLYALKPGLNTVGAAKDATVVLPDGPMFLGHLDCTGASIVWRPASGVAVSLRTDELGAPSVVTQGTLGFFVIERDGRFAARVRDHAWSAKRSFDGISCFDYDPAWRIEAEWKPLDRPRMMEVPNVSGELKSVTVEFQAVLGAGEQTVELLPMSVSEKGVFFVFRDATSGRTTYGAGRFLDADVPRNGRIVLDFNRSFNPPCAFTPFATCPLPPPENWLPFAIAAGEMKVPAH